MPHLSWLVLFDLDFKMKSHSVAQVFQELEAMIPASLSSVLGSQAGATTPSSKSETLGVSRDSKGLHGCSYETVPFTKPVRSPSQHSLAAISSLRGLCMPRFPRESKHKWQYNGLGVDLMQDSQTHMVPTCGQSLPAPFTVCCCLPCAVQSGVAENAKDDGYAVSHW